MIITHRNFLGVGGALKPRQYRSKKNHGNHSNPMNPGSDEISDSAANKINRLKLFPKQTQKIMAIIVIP
jgi:hypothetical protein